MMGKHKKEEEEEIARKKVRVEKVTVVDKVYKFNPDWLKDFGWRDEAENMKMFCTFFLIDGDTDISNTECEIVYVRFVEDGRPVTRLVGQQALLRYMPTAPSVNGSSEPSEPESSEPESRNSA
ncbi:unnamed protein product [Boreogadus saida]